MSSARRPGWWPFLIPLLAIIVALLGTVFFPFANRSTLWFGLPSVGVWSVLWVLAIAPALALVEHAGGYGRTDDARDEAHDEAHQGPHDELRSETEASR